MVNPVNKHSVLKKVRETGEWSGYIAPNKVSAGNILSGWHIGMSILIQLRNGSFVVVNNAQNDDVRSLEETLSNFKYYNCNPILGQNVRFWE